MTETIWSKNKQIVIFLYQGTVIPQSHSDIESLGEMFLALQYQKYISKIQKILMKPG